MAPDPSARSLPAALADWKHCPVCGGEPAPIVSEAGAQPHVRCMNPACGREWWANPKPTASVFAEDPQGRLLLVRRGVEPFAGLWDTPGGFVEHGEEAYAAAVRELLEETGLAGDITGLLGVWGDEYGSSAVTTLNVFYRVYVADISGAAALSDAAELRWFDPDELPPREQIAFACVPRAIAAWAEARGVQPPR